MEQALFFLFEVIALICAIGVVNARNPVHAVLFLVMVFANVASMLLILGLEFIALVYLVVYIGAIAVLFLFVVMMLNVKLVELSTSIFNYLPLNIVVTFLLGYQISYLVYSTFHPLDSIDLLSSVFIMDNITSFSNIQLFGQNLFLFNFFPFIITAVILLVAMIGSILLTLSHVSMIRRQEIYAQNSRNATVVLAR